MKNMKRFLSIILAFTLIIGCCNAIPTFATTAQAETTDEEWTLLGNNNGLSWPTDTSGLESQTIKFGASVKVTKLRFYVTSTYAGGFKLHELEAFDAEGTNLISSARWATPSATLSTNITSSYKGATNFLANGNGGTRGFGSDNDSGWDYFQVNSSSSEQYIEIDFGEKVVDVASFAIWTTYAHSSQGWGNAPKNWKVTGVKAETEDDGFTFLGDNSACSWADTASATFENQEIMFETPVWISKLRLKVTGAYGGQYKISEFEVIDNATGHNVLVPIEENKLCTASVKLSEGMTEDKIKCLTDGAMEPYDSWRYVGSPSNKEYVEYTFDRPYQVKSVKLWCDWCYNASPSWGNAPKSWEVYGYQVHTPVEDTLDDFTGWSDIVNFTAQDGKAVPGVSGECTMYTGNYTMTDYRVEAELSFAKGTMGVITHYTEGDSYYLAAIDKTQDKVFLYKGSTLLADKDWPIDENGILAVTVNAGKVSVWLDEVKMIDYEDKTSLKAGKYGIYAKDAIGSVESVSSYPISVADYLIEDDPFEPAPEPLQEFPTVGDFYVAENGSDANDGKSIDSPFKTIEKAQSAIREAKEKNPDKDYTVIIRGGNYYLDDTITMTAEDGGVGNHRVTYAAYPDETPIISGGKKISSQWTEQENGIWVTTLGEEFRNVDIRQLFVENDRATRSREPDIGDEGADEDGFWPIKDADKTERTWIEPQGTIPEEWNGISGIEMNNRVVWQYVRQPVKSFDTTTNRVYGYSTIGMVGSGGQQIGNKEDWIYFENALLFVDTPGEWFYDKNDYKLYYYPEEGQNPNELEMVIPCVNQLISVIGTDEDRVRNVDFVGLAFCHTTLYMPEEGFHNIQAGNGTICKDASWGSKSEFKASLSLGAINIEKATGCRIQNCEFSMLGEGGICMGQGTNSSLVSGCIITDVGSFGIFLDNKSTTERTAYWSGNETPKGNAIINNYLNHCGEEELATVALLVPVANHTVIRNNTIRNAPYSGISVGWKWSVGIYPSHHNRILSNDVQNAMQIFSDGAGIYVLGEQYHNQIDDNFLKDTGGVNLYFDQSTRYTYASGNYLSFYQVYYNWCYDHELKGVYEKDNQVGAQPDDLSVFGRPLGQMGDVNYDASVDILDLVRYKKYRHDPSIKIDKIAADIDADGYLKNIDVDGLREILVKPKEIPVVQYASKKGLQLTENDVLESATVTSNITVTNTANPALLNDGTIGYGYNSTVGSTVFPEEFTFKWDSVQTGKALRLTVNCAKDQAPTNIEIMVQTETGWKYAAKCNVTWDSSSDGWQYVDIPIEATNITALKLIVKGANFTWGKYAIAEVEVLSEKDVMKNTYASVMGSTLSENNLLRTASFTSVTSGSVPPEQAFDYNISSTYESATSNTSFPEEFIFTWSDAVSASAFRLFANYASQQAPNAIEIYTCHAGDDWKLKEVASISWITSETGNQYVNIPIDATDITGIKIVITGANMTWSKYNISEMELLPSAD